MKTFLIQRNLPGAGLLTPSEKKAIARRSCAVIEELGTDRIQWMHSYITGNHLFCVYKAVNADMLRQHAEKGPFPLDDIHEIFGLMGPETAELEDISKAKLDSVFKNVKNVFATLFMLLIAFSF